MDRSDKVVVLLSGGLDSTTCLALACKLYKDVIALNMIYGQKHIKEIECAKKVAEYYGVEYYEEDLSCVFKYSECPLLEKNGKPIEHTSYAEQVKESENGIVSTYVPFRNGLFLSAATSFAISVGASAVMYGAHADDAAGNAYPDCSVAFAKDMGAAIFEGSGETVSLVAPFVLWTKADIVKLGLELGVPYELTWSCYEGGEKPCGVCGTCRDRQKAFEINGAKDPLM